MAQTFSRAIIVMDYYANTISYAEKCENKATPAMHCNGKCAMMQQLKKEEKKDQQNPERKLEFKTEITLSSKSFFAYITFAVEQDSIKKYFQASDSKTTSMPRAVFHPPCFSSVHLS
jgi:hypothetical protein